MPGKIPVLFLDDEMNVLKTIKRQLAFYDFDVFIANTPEQAFKILDENTVPVVVSDQRMPTMTGSKFLTEVKKRYPETVRMIMSGYSDFGAIQEAINEGQIFKFIQKPWQEDSLVHDLNLAYQQHLVLSLAGQKQTTLNHKDDETHLLSQTGFESELETMIHKTNGDKDLLVIAVYFEKFNSYVNTMGKELSTQLAIELSQQLKKFNPLILGRIKSNMFAFTVEVIQGQPNAFTSLLETVVTEFSSPMICQGKKILFKPYIGVSTYHPTNDSARLLLEEAVVSAEYGCIHKQAIVLFDNEISQSTKRLWGDESDVIDIITDESFSLYYQPQICAQTGVVVGIEVLIHLPEHCSMSVETFISKAESLEITPLVEQQVIAKALKQAMIWFQEGHSFTLSINISPAHLIVGTLKDFLQAKLKQYPFPAHRLIIEVTERLCLSDVVQTEAMVEDLKQLGVQFALDDYGSGFATVAYLTKLPFDTIKLDKSLIETLPNDKDEATLVKHCIDVCKELNLSVVVEGVETHEQLRMMQEFGADIIQGFYYSKPLDAKELSRYIISMSNKKVSR